LRRCFLIKDSYYCEDPDCFPLHQRIEIQRLTRKPEPALDPPCRHGWQVYPLALKLEARQIPAKLVEAWVCIDCETLALDRSNEPCRCKGEGVFVELKRLVYPTADHVSNLDRVGFVEIGAKPPRNGAKNAT
jgi:hypothetical protein